MTLCVFACVREGSTVHVWECYDSCAHADAQAGSAFDQWCLALEGGGESRWVGRGVRGEMGGGLNLPLVLMKTNELTRHDGIAFAKRGAECCIVILCRGWPKEQVDLLFQQEIATVLPSLPPYLFTETLRSLITAPSLHHSLLHVLIRRVIPHIIHPCWQRTTVYVRHRLGWRGLVPKMSRPCWFCIPLPPYGQENREEIHTLGRVMKPGNWRSKEELKGNKTRNGWNRGEEENGAIKICT